MNTTTYALRLRGDLDHESQRMTNEWFFLWYQIGGDRTIEIDGFDGRKITYSGIDYWGSPRIVYWSTIQRYLQKVAAEKYDALELALQSIPSRQRKTAVSETKLLLSSFARTIMTVATAQDRIMRGNGDDFPPLDVDQAQTITGLILQKIDERSRALERHFQFDSRFRMIEERLGEYPNISKLVLGLGTGGLIAAAAGAIFRWIS